MQPGPHSLLTQSLLAINNAHGFLPNDPGIRDLLLDIIEQQPIEAVRQLSFGGNLAQIAHAELLRRQNRAATRIQAVVRGGQARRAHTLRQLRVLWDDKALAESKLGVKITEVYSSFEEFARDWYA